MIYFVSCLWCTHAGGLYLRVEVSAGRLVWRRRRTKRWRLWYVRLRALAGAGRGGDAALTVTLVLFLNQTNFFRKFVSNFMYNTP